MYWNLFLDDERFPIGNEWVIARSFDDAVWCVTAYGLPGKISFDHDLGPGKTGYDFAKWLCEYIMDTDADIQNFQFTIHSQNPVGAVNIQSYMENFIKNFG